MTFAFQFWAAWSLIGAGFELWAIRNKRSRDTLSEFERWLFHTQVKTGRMVWLMVWGAFSVWFLIHIAFVGLA